MTTNRMLVLELASVATAIATVTTIVLALASHHRAPALAAAPEVERSRVELGRELFERKACNVCHTVDGTTRVGPSFLHDYGSTIVLDDGRQVVMDDAYIAESVHAPRAKARPGYPPAMPTYDGTQVTPRELAALTAYIRSLR